MIKNILFISLTIFNFHLKSQNFTANYGFADVSNTTGTIDPSGVPIVTGLTFGSFTANGASSSPGASGRFSFTNWPLGSINNSDNYGDFTGALSPFAFYNVSITVAPGYTLDLNSISFDVRRSGTGIRNYCVRSDRDNYTNNLAASTGTNSKLSVIPDNAFLWTYDSISTSGDQKGSLISLGNQFKQITNSLSFHFYAWNAESSGGSFSIDNVTFKGLLLDSAGASNPVGLKEDLAALDFRVFPNPVRDGLLNIESRAGIFRIEVISLTGKIEKWIENKIPLHKACLSLHDLPGGIYFLRVVTEQGTLPKKIVLSQQ